MARQSVIKEGFSGLFSDLAKISMSDTANTKAQELRLETNLIEMEMRQLAQEIAATEKAFKNQQALFQQSTGEAFKVSDESKTAGFEKFSSSISDPILNSYEKKINTSRQELATKQAQLNSIDQLLQGPLASIRSFYTGAADPAFSGDTNILEASDITPEALQTYLGGQ